MSITRNGWGRRIGAGLLAALAGAGCRSAEPEARPPIVQPGAPGGSNRTISAAEAADLSAIRHTAADVAFMQGMIHHHAQALEMTALLAARSRREDLQMLARRIETSQADEIRMMQRWLEVRGEPAPEHHLHAEGPLMPGMLTADEMARLEAASGAQFDRLFLELMIRHHAGALAMVDELFSEPGAGQDSEIYAFASDVEADQRMEIDRMSLLLQELQP